MLPRLLASFVVIAVMTVTSWTVGAAGAGDGSPVRVGARAAVESATELPGSLLAAESVPPTTTTTAAIPTTTWALNSGSIAADFLADINAIRKAQGLSDLDRSPELDALAQSWTQSMAGDESLRHSQLIYGVIEGDWRAAGENVAYGPTVESIFAGLEASAGHLANMVNSDYTHMGIGVMVMGDVIWTTHLFAG